MHENMNNCFKRMGTRHLHSWGELAFNVIFLLFGLRRRNHGLASLTHHYISQIGTFKFYSFLSFCLSILCSAGSMTLLQTLRTSSETHKCLIFGTIVDFFFLAEALSICRVCKSFCLNIFSEIKLLCYLKLYLNCNLT